MATCWYISAASTLQMAASMPQSGWSAAPGASIQPAVSLVAQLAV